VVARQGQTTRVVSRPSWSPAQFIAVAAGLLLAVIGGVALARTGINFSAVPASRTTVVGLPYTCLSALVQLVVGVLILGGGVFPEAAKSTLGFFGVLLLAFGLVVAIDPTPFVNMWAFTTASGVFYAVVGGIMLLAAALSPVFASRRTVREEVASSAAAPPPAY
jgi:hypothetical protein